MRDLQATRNDGSGRQGRYEGARLLVPTRLRQADRRLGARGEGWEHLFGALEMEQSVLVALSFQRSVR